MTIKTMKSGLQEVLKLMENKYGSYEKLVIYDDGGGMILKPNATEIHNPNAILFDFTSIDELLKHLREKK